MAETVNNYVEQFLERNSFKNVGTSKWANIACVITVNETHYQINFTNYDGDWELYTESLLIPALVGTLTWNSLLDRNYTK